MRYLFICLSYCVCTRISFFSMGCDIVRVRRYWQTFQCKPLLLRHNMSFNHSSFLSKISPPLTERVWMSWSHSSIQIEYFELFTDRAATLPAAFSPSHHFRNFTKLRINCVLHDVISMMASRSVMMISNFKAAPCGNEKL